VDFVAIYTSDNITEVTGLIEKNSIDYILLLDSDYEYFSARGMAINVDKIGLMILKETDCGTLYSADKV
jgi:hypothetical protein